MLSTFIAIGIHILVFAQTPVNHPALNPTPVLDPNYTLLYYPMDKQSETEFHKLEQSPQSDKQVTYWGFNRRNAGTSDSWEQAEGEAARLQFPDFYIITSYFCETKGCTTPEMCREIKRFLIFNLNSIKYECYQIQER